MCRYIRVIVLAALIGFVYSSALRKTKETRHGRFFFDLLGYLHGFKIGKDSALQLAPILFPAPIIIVPSYNQQQSVSIQKGTSEENYQEMGSTIQTITTSAKLIDTTIAPINDDSNTIRQPPKREVSESDSFGQLRQQTENSNTTLTNSSLSLSGTSGISTNPDKNITIATTESMTLQINTSGKYPAAVNSNITVENLTITTEAPKINATPNSNVTIQGINATESLNPTAEEISWSRPLIYPSSHLNGIYGVPYPYPAATYDNMFVNQLLLTTDEPTNTESLPPKGDQRWQMFSGIKNKLDSAVGFRPLAGLYYDGFLHTPLVKKTGWSPNF